MTVVVAAGGGELVVVAAPEDATQLAEEVPTWIQ
jgi:hypothetical protein